MNEQCRVSTTHLDTALSSHLPHSSWIFRPDLPPHMFSSSASTFVFFFVRFLLSTNRFFRQIVLGQLGKHRHRFS